MLSTKIKPFRNPHARIFLLIFPIILKYLEKNLFTTKKTIVIVLINSWRDINNKTARKMEDKWHERCIDEKNGERCITSGEEKTGARKMPW